MTAETPPGPVPPPSGGRATLVATVTEARQLADLSLPAPVEVLEWRADLCGDAAPEVLRERFPGRLLYTLRSREEGGRDGGPVPERWRRLREAASRGYDLVDLEADRDVVDEVLAAVPAERRVLSWHGGPSTVDDLKARFAEMVRVAARLYKLVPAARQSGEELGPLLLLTALGRPDVVAFATGAVGQWTRLWAPRLGAPWVYGSAGDEEAAPGQLPVARLVSDYGLPELPPVERVFGIVGNPVAHSLSPRLHNGAYRALGIPALYLAFHAPSFGDFWLEVVESPALETLRLPLCGLSVTSPFKSGALAVAGAPSPLAERIGGANTLRLTEGVWEAESTDPDGVVLPLEQRGVTIGGAAAAVFGTGGAGRAAAVGLARAGARVVLVNRSAERGREAARILGLPFLPWSEADPGGFGILVNATPLGRDPSDPLPFPPEAVSPGTVVVDMVYGPAPTRLVGALRVRGVTAVDGREMLLFQAFSQFRLMTGRELPPELGRGLLGLGAA